MKKSIKKIGLLSLVLIIISAIVILLFGKTYIVDFNLNGKSAYELKVDNESGEVEILDEKKDNDRYQIKVKAKKAGKAYLSINYGDYQEEKMLYINKNMKSELNID